jgi:hypothetical protein
MGVLPGERGDSMKGPILVNGATGVNAMGKLLEFNDRKLVRKSNQMPKGQTRGKVIEFRKQTSVNSSRNAEIRRPDNAMAQAQFFWSVC